ncbi:MAG TPA: cytochrome c family protein [Sphingomonadales bacterium]
MKRTLGLAALLAVGLASTHAMAEGDPAKGEKLFNRCKACHTVEAGGTDRQGPNLHGVFGRKAGTKEGYNYSKAMANADVVWSEETIDKYIADPKAFIPNNKMIFVGIKNEAQRADLIAYLKQATK